MLFGSIQYSPGQNHKNILFLAVDDLKPLIQSFGESQIISPNIDRIAEKGVTFTRNYCQKAVCGPTRSSLLTGMRPDRTRVWDLKTLIRDIQPDVVTLPQHFKNNGYETAAIGKIFDPRNVDNGHDAISWSIPYVGSSKLPLAAGYEDLYYGHYQSQEVKDQVEFYKLEAMGLGLTGSDVDDYVKERVKPSFECADVPDNAYRDGAHTVEAIRLINEFSQSNKPFFLGLGFKKPHLPFVAPKKYWDLYKREDIEISEFQAMSLNSPIYAYSGSTELSGYTDIPDLADFTNYENNILDSDEQKELIHAYYACISYIDAQIGMVLDELEDKGLLENTIIVFWGDHGFHLGDHAMWGKHTVFEQATRAPLIISAPGYSQGKRSTALTEFVDIYPTLCDLAELSVPGTLDGTSLLPVLSNPKKESKEFSVSQFSRSGQIGYSIRTDQYRYTEWHANGYHSFDPYDTMNISAIELYDYQADSLETENLYGKENISAIQSDLHLKLKSFLETGQIPLIVEAETRLADSGTSVYPNPTDGIVYFDSKEYQAGDIKIYNANGQLLYVSYQDPVSTIDLSKYKPGMYLVEINAESFIIVKK